MIFHWYDHSYQTHLEFLLSFEPFRPLHFTIIEGFDLDRYEQGKTDAIISSMISIEHLHAICSQSLMRSIDEA